jgi:hypothetical protein
MALSKIDVANFLDGTIPQGNVANASLGAVTALPAGVGGKVLQVVSSVNGTGQSNTSTTYADTGLTATITPSSTSSKILITFVHNGVLKRNVASSLGVNIGLFRGSTQLDTVSVEAGWTNTTDWNDIGAVGATYLDSPSTTSATVYKTQFRCQNVTGEVNINSANAGSYITLMEIAG